MHRFILTSILVVGGITALVGLLTNTDHTSCAVLMELKNPQDRLGGLKDTTAPSSSHIISVRQLKSSSGFIGLVMPRRTLQFHLSQGPDVILYLTGTGDVILRNADVPSLNNFSQDVNDNEKWCRLDGRAMGTLDDVKRLLLDMDARGVLCRFNLVDRK